MTRLIFLIFVLSSVTSTFAGIQDKQARASTSSESVSAVIIDKTGSKTTVSNLKTLEFHSCDRGAITYLGEATVTHFLWDLLPLWVRAYKVDVPLNIIRQIKVQEVTEQVIWMTTNWKENRSIEYTVVLHDGTVIKGFVGTIREFTGKTELGIFSIPTWEVREITFLTQPAQPGVSAVSPSGQVLLRLTDGVESLEIEGATFVTEVKNKNGCRTGSEKLASFPFSVGSSQYNIELARISGIEFSVGPPGKCPDFFPPGECPGEVRLLSATGAEYRGYFLARLESGIEGVTTIGGHKVKITIPVVTAKSFKVSVSRK